MVMLHLGCGAFHRAHQALYLQWLHDRGDTSWSLVSGNLRPDMADVIAALQRQGGEYTLETVSPAGERRYEHIRSIRKVIGYEPSLAELIGIGASSATRIISFTVTEAGYYLDAHDQLDLNFADLRLDLERARRRVHGRQHELRTLPRSQARTHQLLKGKTTDGMLVVTVGTSEQKAPS